MLSSSSRWGWLLKPVRNLLYLPSTLYRGPLAKTREALLTHEPRTLLLHGFELAANAAWWGATLYAAWLAWQAVMRQRSSSSPEPWICALVFALGNLCLVLLLQSPDARFTYFWFALGPAAIFAALAHKRYSIGLATALGLSLVVPQVFALNRALSADAINDYLLSKRSGAALTQLLGQLPPRVIAVYLVDDVIAQGTAPEYLARFAGFHGKLTVINSVTPILGCQAPQSASSRYRLHSSPDSMTLDYTAPACFYQVNQAPLRLFDGHGAIERGPWMKYDYPRLAVSAPAALRATTNDYDPGSQWSVTVTDPACVQVGACVWLGLDPAHQTYYVLH